MDKKKGRQSDADARGLILTGILFLLIACFMGIFWGRVKGTNLITFSIRLPRTIAGIFCGAGLSVAGLLLQSSLHNSLCSPGIIGINQGAGVVLFCGGTFIGGARVRHYRHCRSSKIHGDSCRSSGFQFDECTDAGNHSFFSGSRCR